MERTSPPEAHREDLAPRLIVRDQTTQVMEIQVIHAWRNGKQTEIRVLLGVLDVWFAVDPVGSTPKHQLETTPHVLLLTERLFFTDND